MFFKLAPDFTDIGTLACYTLVISPLTTIACPPTFNVYVQPMDYFFLFSFHFFHHSRRRNAIWVIIMTVPVSMSFILILLVITIPAPFLIVPDIDNRYQPITFTAKTVG